MLKLCKKHYAFDRAGDDVRIKVIYFMQKFSVIKPHIISVIFRVYCYTLIVIFKNPLFFKIPIEKCLLS